MGRWPRILWEGGLGYYGKVASDTMGRWPWILWEGGLGYYGKVALDTMGRWPWILWEGGLGYYVTVHAYQFCSCINLMDDSTILDDIEIITCSYVL